MKRCKISGCFLSAKFHLNVVEEAAAINEEKLKQAEHYDGLYIIQINTELPTEEVALSNRDLWQIERAFRGLKSHLGSDYREQF